jgi:transposase
MARRIERVTDAQWAKIEPLLPKLKRTHKGGRPWSEPRRVFEGILWLLKSGARWKDLPTEYPSPSTCWRWLKRWEEQGVWLTLWRAFLGELDLTGRLKWSDCFIDASFVPAKRGASGSASPSALRARSV